MKPVHGVYLSDTLDLADLFAEAFAPYEGTLQLFRPDDVPDPDAVTFALSWYPGAAAFDRFPAISLVSSIAAGVDNILACPSLPANAQVMRVRDPEQAQHMAAFGLWHVIGAHREMARYDAQQAQRIWRKHPYRPASKTNVTVLGYGLMGAALVRALAGMGYAVTTYSKDSSPDVPEGVRLVTEKQGKLAAVRDSNIVVNLLPGTTQTVGILDKALFAEMATGATLINLGRGDHLIETDLLDALAAGQLRRAALDVTATEPLPRDHPFWTHPAITLTPHVAAESSFETVAEIVVADVKRMQNGQGPVGLVDKRLGF